jgi:hypothetical protein
MGFIRNYRRFSAVEEDYTMSFSLHLYLKGLCALIPHEPITTLPVPPNLPMPLPLPLTLSELRVVLPDVHVERQIGPHEVCAHQPVLRVEQVDGTFQELPIVGDDINISTVDMSSPGVELRPTFGFVASLVRAKPDFQVDAALFSTPLTRGDVAARFEIRAAKAFGTDFLAQAMSFPTTPPYTGTFAQGVRLEIPIMGVAGSFQLTPLNGGAPRTIAFGAKNDGSPVKAELKNLCDQVVMSPLDADFAAFYLLESQLRPPFLVPKALIKAREVLGVASNSSTCVPGTTNHL